MLRGAAVAGALILAVSCSKAEGGDATGSAVAVASGSAARSGSGARGGFSADLAKELGSGAAVKAAGSADTRSGSDADKAGSDAVGLISSDAPKAGSDAPKARSNAVAMAGSAAKPDPAPKAGTPASGPGAVPEAHGPVKVSAELAAVKLSLLPNWDRDVDAPGTFQYVVRIKGTRRTKTFSFHYGYDDPKAPADRDQYKKYLQNTKILVGVIKDRQRGAAWFLEGTDASGLPAFRYVVLYGGKRLICYGSLYKDADASRLGDDRDQTVIQAKQICETLAL